MGTRIVGMKDGLLQQVDAPQKLYDYPANLFVAGFIGTPQMNFFDAVLTSDAEGKVYVEFEGNKVALPKAKSDKIINIEEYLNTGKPVVFGVRPEDFHDEAGFISNSKETVISVKVEVVEKLGAETLLYCVFSKEEAPAEEDGKVKSLVDSATQMIAKVDSRSKTERDQVVELAIDIMHSHLFDKETELTILEGEGTKAYVPVVELQRQEEKRKYAEEHPEEAEEKPKFFGLFGKKKKAKVEAPVEAPAEEKAEETPAEEAPAEETPVEE